MGRHAQVTASEAASSSGHSRLGWALGAAVVASAIAAASVWAISGSSGPTTASPADARVAPAASSGSSSSPSAAGLVAEPPTPSASPTPEPSAATTSSAPACAASPALRVATTPGLAPVLTEIADAECVDLVVTSSVAVEGAQLLKAGAVDVWVPDSREYGSVLGAQAFTAPAVAWSPVVMVAEPSTATAVSAAGPVPWVGVVAGAGKLGDLPVQLQAESSGVGFALGGALLTGATAASGGDHRLGLAGTAGALVGLTRLEPGQESEAVPPGVVRVIELRHRGAAVVVPTVEGYPVLEAPWLAADPTGPAAAASAKMLAGLSSESGRAALSEHGFVAPGGEQVMVAPQAGGQPILATDPAQVALLWAMTGEGARPGNTLAVLDVSGSMSEVQLDGTTPMQGVKASVPLMLGALTAETKVGMWTFGNQLAPPQDWIEQVPLGPLQQNTPLIQDVMNRTEALRTGTSLNATVLDAYIHLQANYDPAATNILGIFTDGRNEDAPYGIDLAALQAELAARADPTKPIILLCFGFGAADVDALQQMVAANGGLGGVWEIQTPAHIIGAMIEATAATITFG